MFGKIFTQETKQLSAYQRKAVHSIQHTTMEFLEKYIEVAGYYPDWEERKQIKDNGVTRTDIIGNPEKAERWFSTTLMGFAQALADKPEFLHEELKQEFYKWISATGIDKNNCPERLKLILYGFHEILEGHREKIMKEFLSRKEVANINAADYDEKLNDFFFKVQTPLESGREQEALLSGKNYDEVEIKSKFGKGNDKKGKENFEQIAQIVAFNYDNFHFWPQKEKSQRPWAEGTSSVLTDKIKQSIHEWNIEEVEVFDGYSNRNYYGEIKELALVHNSVNLNSYSNYDKGYLKVDPRRIYFKNSLPIEQWNEVERLKGLKQSNNPQQKTNYEIIQDVKNNRQNWRIDEVITGYDVFNKPRKENALIHQSAQIGIDGEIFGSLNMQPIYLATKFNQEEIVEIKRTLNIVEDDENSKIIEGIKTDINNWKIETIQGNEWIVYNQAQRVDSEIGHLIHPKQRFTDEEWDEIKNALNSSQSWGSRVVSNILPTNFGNRKNYSLGKINSVFYQKDDRNGIGKIGIVALISGVVVLVGAVIYLVVRPKKIKKIGQG